MLLSSRKWFLLLLLLSSIGEANSWRRRRTRVCSATNCQVTSWYSWGPCSNTCGFGTKTRTRAVTRQPSCGGSCPYSLTDSSSCYQNSYTSCQVSQWSSWSTCSSTCGLTGTKRRTRYLTRYAACGRSCPYSHSLSESTSCNQNLGSNCTLTQWTTWTTCQTICGVLGKQRRHRGVISPPSCGGQCKENLFASKGCHGDCSMCVMGPWSAWKACTAPCGSKGKKERLTTYTCGNRHPEIKQHAECVGDCCYTKCRTGYVAVGTYPLCHCVQNRWGDGNNGAGRDQGCITCLIVAFLFSVFKIW